MVVQHGDYVDRGEGVSIMDTTGWMVLVVLGMAFGGTYRIVPDCRIEDILSVLALWLRPDRWFWCSG